MRIFKQITLTMLLFFSSMALQAEDVADEVEPFSEAELEQILAPIALYPDTVLSHILIAATYPLEVIQAERWTTNNPDYEGSEAVEAVNDKDWDPSVKALVAFPQVLKRLSENLEWTQKLGDAFLQDEEKLLASVQSLRQRAYKAGNLEKMDKVNVTHEDDSSIVIEPIEREVVYVPYYDTRVIYGSWHWSHYPPVYWHTPHYASNYYDHHTPFYWGPRIRVSFGFFFSSFHWHNRHLVRIHHDHYRPRHYYDRHQIRNHEHARRWAHNPTHRRGVSYRSVTVRNRYQSDRLSQTEIRTHRSKDKTSVRNSNRINDNRVTTSRTKEGRTGKKRDTRIATPDRIREELKDGRISVKERNARPTNRNASNQSTINRNNSNRNSSNRDVKGNKTPRTNRSEGSSSNRTKNPKSSTRTTPPVKNESSGRSNGNKERTAPPPKQPSATRKESNSRSSSSSSEYRPSNSNSSRSSSPKGSSSRSSSSHRSSSSNKSNRSNGSRDKKH